MLSMGIVGLPNVGKSTLWNALTAGAAKVSNYPFTTIDPNVGVVPVPDPRLAALARLLDATDATPSAIEFIDIAGLVEGASRGEGLGNRFLAEIREVDAICHVVRAFEEGDVVHGRGAVDPEGDARVIETELALADLELLGRVAERREREWKADPKGHEVERERLERWRRALEEGRPLRALDLDEEETVEARRLGLLTGKPVLYLVNISEDELDRGEEFAARLGRRLGGEGPAAEVLPLAVRLEGELAQLEAEERDEFARELGLETSGLERLTTRAFELLGLIRFYTIARGKLTAWAVPSETPAPAAAGRIHGDMERGFIRAQVASFEALVEAGSWQALQRSGQLRTEGRGYAIRDGDVVEFLFQP